MGHYYAVVEIIFAAVELSPKPHPKCVICRSTYPHDPARPDVSRAEMGSPWSLDSNKKVLFASLPHNAADATQKLRGLLAQVDARHTASLGY